MIVMPHPKSLNVAVPSDEPPSNPRSRGAVGREPVGAHEFVLLTDARFVLKPDFDSFAGCFRGRDSA